MKVWEKAFAKQVEEIKGYWKEFAEKGDCTNIECRFCPTQCIDRIVENVKVKDLIKGLNEEVKE